MSKKSRFSNRAVKHSSRTIIACNIENENRLSVYPHVGWFLQMQVTYYTEQLLSFEYQLLELKSSIRNHAANILYTVIHYVHTRLQR